MTKESHLERTAKEPRNTQLHTVVLQRVDQINPSIRLFRLEIPENGTIDFLPGQWLDVYVPNVPKAGGFTITSSPSRARPGATGPGYLELAIQKSPDNPPAHWLWRPVEEILHAELRVRVGGSFVWPPPALDISSVRTVVLVAGGVGINPLISILSALAEEKVSDRTVHFLYSMKDPGPDRSADEMLFLERIVRVFSREQCTGGLSLFLTGDALGSEEATGNDVVSCNEVDVPFSRRRIATSDVMATLGKDKDAAVVYVCGLPTMTDHFVGQLTSKDGIAMARDRILYEKWW